MYIDDGLRAPGAEHVEIRAQVGESTKISFRGCSIDTLSGQLEPGGAVRVLVNGWGFASFNQLEDMPARAPGRGSRPEPWGAATASSRKQRPPLTRSYRIQGLWTLSLCPSKARSTFCGVSGDRVPGQPKDTCGQRPVSRAGLEAVPVHLGRGAPRGRSAGHGLGGWRDG